MIFLIYKARQNKLNLVPFCLYESLQNFYSRIHILSNSLPFAYDQKVSNLIFWIFCFDDQRNVKLSNIEKRKRKKILGA